MRLKQNLLDVLRPYRPAEVGDAGRSGNAWYVTLKRPLRRGSRVTMDIADGSMQWEARTWFWRRFA